MDATARIRRWLLIATMVVVAATMPSALGRVGFVQVTVGGSGLVLDQHAVRAWDARIGSMLRGGELVIRRVDQDTMVSGRQHERLSQHYGGVPVFGGELVRQLDGAQTVSVFGGLYEGISLATEPTLTTSDAVAAVTTLTGVTLNATHQPELVILPLNDGGYALTYRARVMTGGDVVVYFIDAHSGAVTYSYSDLKTTVGTGTGVLGDTKKISTTSRTTTYVAWDQMRPATIYTFDMKGSLSRTWDFLNGQITLGESDLGSDADNTWHDTATVDAHVYAGWTYDYLYRRFGRAGLDNANLRMLTLVHPVNRSEIWSQPADIINTFYVNAFYYGEGVMVYGEGLPAGVTADGYGWNYFSGALDVVAHELTHGVTEYTSDLIYQNEPGALNEAFSDIVGTSAEFFYQEPGAGYLKADYLIGEDLTSPLHGLRSMANPQEYGDPDHYSKRFLGNTDRGGVHINSSIANHAFYLTIEGGTNRTSGITVVGVGSANRERVERVFFRAFTALMPSNASFSTARAATIQAARDLYGTGSDTERAITDAWTACGVN
jgi:bacillolysin